MREHRDTFWSTDGARRTLVWTFRAPRQLEVRFLDEDDRPLAEFLLPSRFYGNYGGYELVLSPDEAFAALYMHSGQSEQGYELFAVADEIRHLPGLPFVLGEGGPPEFSPGDAHLAFLNFMPSDVCLLDDPARVFYAELYTQPLRPPAAPSRHEITIPLATGETPEQLINSRRGPRGLRFLDRNTLTMRLPARRIATVALPAPAEIVATLAPAG